MRNKKAMAFLRRTTCILLTSCMFICSGSQNLIYALPKDESTTASVIEDTPLDEPVTQDESTLSSESEELIQESDISCPEPDTSTTEDISKAENKTESESVKVEKETESDISRTEDLSLDTIREYQEEEPKDESVTESREEELVGAAQYDLSNASYKTTVTLKSSSYEYNGYKRSPIPTVKTTINGKTIELTKGTDYKVAYANNINPGKAAVRITGMGKYTGTVKKYFKIVCPVSKLKYSYKTKCAFTGKNIKPSITVLFEDRKLTSGTHYTVSYGNNYYPGTATIKIKGKGYFSGTVNKTFKIYLSVAGSISDKGTYIIIPKGNLKRCLTVEQDKYNNNTPAILWDYTNKESMHWYIQKVGTSSFYIRNQLTDLLLAAKNGNTDRYTQVLSKTPSSNKTQTWKFIKNSDGTFSIYNIYSGKYLQLKDNSTNNHTTTYLNLKSESNGQKFYFVKVSNATPHKYSGRYYITSKVDSNYALSIQGTGKENGNNVCLKKTEKKSHQIFDVLYSGNGYYRIQNTYSGKVLDVTGANKANGTNVQQYEWNKSNAQKWKLSGSNNSGIIIKSALGKTLDLYAGKAKEDANIQIYTNNNTNAQKWIFNSYSLNNKIVPKTTKADVLLEKAHNYMNYCRMNGIYYQTSTSYPPGSDGHITCGGLCFRALYEMGYGIPKNAVYCTAVLEGYLPSTGMVKSTSYNDIKPGSIVIVAAGAPNNYHSFIVKSYNPSTRALVRYDAGGGSWIRSIQPLSGTFPANWTLLSVWNFKD